MGKGLLIIKSRDLRVAQDLPSALYDRRITDFAAIHIGFGVYRNNIMIETDPMLIMMRRLQLHRGGIDLLRGVYWNSTIMELGIVSMTHWSSRQATGIRVFAGSTATATYFRTFGDLLRPWQHVDAAVML